MKRNFFEYYNPSPYQFKKIWQEAVIVLDSNILLGLYRMPSASASKLLVTLEKTREKLWLPHQVGLEFSRSRLKVISDLMHPFEKIDGILDKATRDIDDVLDAFEDHPFMDLKEIRETIDDEVGAVRDEITSKKPEWKVEDKILKKLNSIFTGRVGKGYPKDKLKEVYEDIGPKRYEKAIPPGYLDSKKDSQDKTGEKKYGDLVLWLQMIDHSKRVKKPIIFVTDEKKEDWWWYEGGRFIGPKANLRREMWDEAGVYFFMYKMDDFIEKAGKRLSLEIDEKLVEDIKNLIETDRKREIKEQSSDVNWSGHLITSPKEPGLGWVIEGGDEDTTDVVDLTGGAKKTK